MSQSLVPAPDSQKIPGVANLLKASVLVAGMLASFFVAEWTAGVIAEMAPGTPAALTAKWIFVGAMGIWNSMLLVGMGILAHDAVHRVLFRTPFWNELIGGLLSALATLPFYANRQFHLTHHAFAHQPGLDPEDEMHRYPFVLAATLGSVLALYLQYRNVFRNIVHFRDPHRAARAAKDILLLSSAGLFYLALVPALGLSLGLTVIPMLLALLPVFAWRALSDHYGVPPVERAAAPRAVVDVEPQDGDASARKRGISGWVIRTNPWLEWLWSSVNYHEVHHRYPWLSHIHLKQAYEATRESEPYLVVRGYWSSLLNIARGQYYQSPEQVRRFLVSSTPLP